MSLYNRGRKKESHLAIPFPSMTENRRSNLGDRVMSDPNEKKRKKAGRPRRERRKDRALRAKRLGKRLQCFRGGSDKNGAAGQYGKKYGGKIRTHFRKRGGWRRGKGGPGRNFLPRGKEEERASSICLGQKEKKRIERTRELRLQGSRGMSHR